jgi:hypothetical protein
MGKSCHMCHSFHGKGETIFSMGRGDDAAECAGSAEVHPVTYTCTSSPLPPDARKGSKLRGAGGRAPRKQRSDRAEGKYVPIGIAIAPNGTV